MVLSGNRIHFLWKLLNLNGNTLYLMKVVLINTYDIQGGAARAAYRLHKGLLQHETDSRLLVLNKNSDDSFVIQITCHASKDDEIEKCYFNAIQNAYINANRTEISNTLFSLPYPGYDLSMLPEVQNADIINLHWVAWYQSPITLQKLFELGKPVVWTLHDQWAFTGGCHYSAGCNKYKRDCSSCPQLADDPFGLPEKILKDKRDLFKGANLTLVTPSRWLSECANESNLFKKLRIITIPNAVETDLFIPISKETARQNLGLPLHGLIVLFGSENGDEKRKGFKEMLSAIRMCMNSDKFARLVKDNKINFTCFGRPSKELEAAGINVCPLGYLDSDEQMRDAYSAADIFILPSLEDNLPNTMLESMSCGTPVISFEVGGIPDVIINGHTGMIVPCSDTDALGNAILSLVFDQNKRDLLSQNCRTIMVEKYALRNQAQDYLKLYAELLKIPVSQSRFVANRDTIELTNASVNTQLGPHVKQIYNQILFRSLKEYTPKQLRDAHDRETMLNEQVAQMRQWAERAEQILSQERKQVKILEAEIVPLQAFAKHLRWFYKIYLYLRRKG